jgi:hypothetical protein
VEEGSRALQEASDQATQQLQQAQVRACQAQGGWTWRYLLADVICGGGA